MFWLGLDITPPNPQKEQNTTLKQGPLLEQRSILKGLEEEEVDQREKYAVKTTFRFGAEREGLQNKRGYRTSELSLDFWKTFDLIPPSVSGASKLEVIPLLIRKKDPLVE